MNIDDVMAAYSRERDHYERVSRLSMDNNLDSSDAIVYFERNRYQEKLSL